MTVLQRLRQNLIRNTVFYLKLNFLFQCNARVSLLVIIIFRVALAFYLVIIIFRVALAFYSCELCRRVIAAKLVHHDGLESSISRQIYI
jgi:hypothetical protein